MAAENALSDAASGRGIPAGGISPAVQLTDHFFPNGGIRVRLVGAAILEHETAHFRFLVMARGAVKVQERLS